ncbi:MAG: hypothetical protein AAGI11_06405 [Pseudomonadota bacterium]
MTMTEEVTPTETPKPEATPAPAQPAPVAPATPEPVQLAQPDLKETAEALLSQVPEHLRGTIPDTDPVAQIKWFATAQKSGAFSTGAPTVPETDSGKPTVTPVEPNLDDLPATARMARGYGQ